MNRGTGRQSLADLGGKTFREATKGSGKISDSQESVNLPLAYLEDPSALTPEQAGGLHFVEVKGEL